MASSSSRGNVWLLGGGEAASTRAQERAITSDAHMRLAKLQAAFAWTPASEGEMPDLVKELTWLQDAIGFLQGAAVHTPAALPAILPGPAPLPPAPPAKVLNYDLAEGTDLIDDYINDQVADTKGLQDLASQGESWDEIFEKCLEWARSPAGVGAVRDHPGLVAPDMDAPLQTLQNNYVSMQAD